MQTVKMVLPNVTFEDELILHTGSRTIELRYLGRGNTRGDVIAAFGQVQFVIPTVDVAGGHSTVVGGVRLRMW
jgi:hypothetical protein